MKVAFIHPDLGIGGAERLIVDAAVGLLELNKTDVNSDMLPTQQHFEHEKQGGNEVVIYTSQYDINHAFSESVIHLHNHGRIRVRGRLTNPLNGRLMIVFASIRQFLLTVQLLLFDQWRDQFDVFVVDQLAYCMPLLYCFTRKPILFYCHYPDLLLSRGHDGAFVGRLMQNCYRWPFDWLESFSMRYATLILCNSKFTLGVTRCTFPQLQQQGLLQDDDVLYPAVSSVASSGQATEDASVEALMVSDQSHMKRRIVSLNRFERKKNIKILVSAFQKLAFDENIGQDLQLVIAGGYDHNNKENVEHMSELWQICSIAKLDCYVYWCKHPLKDHKFDELKRAQVLFIPSFSEEMRRYLLTAAARPIVVYTPRNEHFGIVPLEAMQMGVPVVAFASGGPLETVVDGRTGRLVPDSGSDYDGEILLADTIRKLLDMSVDKYNEMSEYARLHVSSKFGMDRFIMQLNAALSKMVTSSLQNSQSRASAMSLIIILVSLAVAVLSLKLIGVMLYPK